MKQDQSVPRINANDLEVEVLRWLVTEGSLVEKGQDIVEIGTSKAAFTVQAEFTGFVQFATEAGSMLEVGDVLLSFFTEKEFEKRNPLPSVAHLPSPSKPEEAPVLPSAPVSVSAPPVRSQPSHSQPTSPPRFSKGAQELLQKHGLSPELFGGLVTRRQIEEKLFGAPVAAAVPPPKEDIGLRSRLVGRAKQAEIENLQLGESGNIVSSLTVQFPSDGIRARLVEENLFGESLLPLVLFEVAQLASTLPELTAYFCDGKIFYYDRVDLGVAMDLGKGLKVVTFPAANEMLPIQHYEKLVDASARYMSNELRLEELTHSTITVTDLSSFNILSFQPLINGRQSVILGLGGDSSAPGSPYSITAAFDHRILTGRDIGNFLGELKKRLLSYARTKSAPTLASLSFSSESSCDRCLIPINSYYEEFPSEGMMALYVRPDGTVGLVCHSCNLRP